MYIKKIVSVLIGLSAFCASYTNAKTFYIDEGESQVIKLDKKIDTIFISAPSVADYHIIDDYSFILYAKAEGRAEVDVFDENGDAISSDTIHVNNFVDNVTNTNQQIKARFPNSKLSVKKVGKAYVIEGNASSENEREEITRIVGAALGEKPKIREYKLKRGDAGNEDIPFLNKYEYDSVVDNTNLDDSTQLNVKLTVVEVNKNFSEALGINWSRAANVIAPHRTVSADVNSETGLSLVLNSDTLSLFIDALNNQDNGKILAEPNISMMSGETADILIGGEIPLFRKEKDSSPSLVYKNFGINLVVGAKLQKNNRIRLILSQEVSNIVGNYSQGSGIAVPYFSTRRSKSTFEIADGESFIIGGLFSSNDAEGLSKVPLLGDIPILGAFFRNARTNRDTKELVIVATVNVIKPVNGKDIVYPDFINTGTMERFFNSPFSGATGVESSNFLRKSGFIQ